jgi:hypothetical protein
MPTDKRSTTYRLSEEARRGLKRLAAHHGISETAVMEMIVRRAVRQDLPPEQPEPESVPAPPPKPQRKPRKGSQP